MNDFNRHIGKNIRTQRLKCGFSRERLGEMAGVNDKFLYEIETGRKGLTINKMAKISKALDSSIDFLVSEEGEEYSDRPQCRNNCRYARLRGLLDKVDDRKLSEIELIVAKIISISEGGDKDT